MTMPRPAVFLDRDGTLNVDDGYLTVPEAMRLLPGVGDALQLLRSAGFALVVVTNQSAIGRGMMTAADLQCVHGEMNRQLAELGIFLDGIYHCPAVSDDHPDRKPAPGMLLRAAAELHLDLPSSWMIGDRIGDIRAGQNAGCRGCVLVRSGMPIDETQAGSIHVADDLLTAVRHILGS